MDQEQTAAEKAFLDQYDVSKYERPSVTADVIIFTMDDDNELNILLIKRGNHPYKDYWAIPGGFLETGRESIDEAAARELYEETGIKADDGIDLRQLITVGTPDRDPRTHVVSVVYTALVPKGLLQPKAGDDAKEAKLFKIRKGYDENGDLSIYFVGDKCSLTMKNIAFDHEDLIITALKRLRGRLNYTDDAFSLLQDKDRFDILELLRIHEAILFQKLDKPNFRRMFMRDYLGKHRVKELGQYAQEGKRKTTLYKYLPSNRDI
ncbi:8-oxo-dGTP diphosphatase [Selenomonas ruminantium]|jgi:8-oxo-dGTP diphosphatase|uniref:8-oxo-dGTP diphosphatase n=1 Tax=Selenomonas ruminantium TaxID=971 RepID=A0A1I3ENT5_SELRU|nr:NUDIX domain-containing protein [Selenomonas ruminantium]MBE6075027.1 NUDIX domain-containing protein [Selenomonas ruminantium]MBQ1889498.1 NUDIX hydrolase [Selenomonas sp.]SFI00676.1 8-oxo-dGTP diphosphatase [Selenomonas ruminantium]